MPSASSSRPRADCPRIRQAERWSRVGADGLLHAHCQLVQDLTVCSAAADADGLLGPWCKLIQAQIRQARTG